MQQYSESSRRRILKLAGAGMLVAAATWRQSAHAAEAENQDEGVTPTEDLMREHGVLKRVMLIYEEIVRRMVQREDVPPQALGESAGIIRQFIEDYHEKLEENHVFPRFEKANTLVELVKTLREQHDAGRKVTDIILQHAAAQRGGREEGRRAVVSAIREFNRMYAPHEAREDTVLFPAFRRIAGKDYEKLGDEFEEQETRLFGEGGFEKMVEKVAGIERSLGIYDLAQFTPKV